MSEATKTTSDVFFQPVIFWASIISFFASFYVAIFKSNHIQSPEVFAFEIFCVFYIARIYMGILMVTYDESIKKALLSVSRVRRRNYYFILFGELFICLMVGYFFARFEDNAAAYIIMTESLLLLLFWFNFYKEFLVDDVDRRANYFTLVVDAVCFIGALLFLFRDTISTRFEVANDVSEAYLVGSVSAFIIIVSILFILEIFLVYSESLKRFIFETGRIFKMDD